MDISESSDLNQPDTDQQQSQSQQQPQCQQLLPFNNDNSNFDLINNSMNNMNINKSTTPTTTTTTTAAMNGSNNSDSTELDFSSLLQQFNCLGTTDHEELVNQLQKLMDYQISRNQAVFFLEGNNWNLQAAICCYLECISTQKLPSMKLLEECRPYVGVQIWRLENNGDEIWPNGCYLWSAGQEKKSIPSVPPGATTDVIINIPLINQPILWRMSTPNGWNFGDKLWMMPADSDDDNRASTLTQQMAQLCTTTTTTTNTTTTAPQPMTEDNFQGNLN